MPFLLKLHIIECKSLMGAHRELVLNHDLKRIKVKQEYSAAHHIINSLLHFWESGKTRTLVFRVILD